MLILKLLERELDQRVPGGLRMAREFSVRLAERQRPEPDPMLVRADAFKEPDQTWFAPEVVELAVEVLSPESETRGRERNPRLHARAGVRFFWWIEQDGNDTALYEYEKDPASPSGDHGRPTIHRGTYKTTVPVGSELDLTDILHR